MSKNADTLMDEVQVSSVTLAKFAQEVAPLNSSQAGPLLQSARDLIACVKTLKMRIGGFLKKKKTKKMLTNFKNSYLKQISEANRNPPEIAQSLKDLWQSELNLVEQLSSMDLDELLLDKNHSKFVDSLKELTAFCRKEAVVSTTWFNFCNKLLFEKIFCF